MIRLAQIIDARAIAEVHVASWKATCVGQFPDEYLAGLSVPTRESAWRGIGAHLWKSGIESLNEQHFDEVTVWVLDRNLPARRFYEGLGCSIDGGKKLEKIGGQDVLEIRYRVCLK